MVEPHESVMVIVRECAAKYGDDIPKAVKEEFRRVKKLPEYEDIVGGMVQHCLREWTYDVRHKDNIDMRNAAGELHSKAKVVVGDSDAVQQVAKSLFNYHIAGTLLGLVLGEDLEAISQSEDAKADGHAFNARLTERLMKVVPKVKSVREALTDRRLATVWRAAEKDAA